MVSEKLIIALIIVAILLSAVSIVVTVSTVNTKMIPETNVNENIISDDDAGQVSLIVNPQVNPPS